jgi:hypothetical protein
MKRVEFTITAHGGELLREPGFIENCSELPLAIKRAVEDFFDAHGDRVALPITIQVQPAPSTPTC